MLITQKKTVKITHKPHRFVTGLTTFVTELLLLLCKLAVYNSVEMLIGAVIQMKKRFFKGFVLTLCFVLSALPFISNFNVATAKETEIDEQKILETRFLNMLNHNYVYGDEFDSLETIVNNSVVALLELRDIENPDYITENAVEGYLYDMFGLESLDFKGINPDFPQTDGYVYILPRGYAEYEHKAVSLTKCEDGTYLFETSVNIKTHDKREENLICKTRFTPNPSSSFGFNIVTSEIL